VRGEEEELWNQWGKTILAPGKETKKGLKMKWGRRAGKINPCAAPLEVNGKEVLARIRRRKSLFRDNHLAAGSPNQ
jgi:hypothetical protein